MAKQKKQLFALFLLLLIPSLFAQEFRCGLTVVFYGEKVYHTVKIDEQCWLRENLDIGTILKSRQRSTNNNVIEKYCYEDVPLNCIKYGALYSWSESMKYSKVEGSQGICPSGWHIPTISEFEDLITAVDDDGNALKESGIGSGNGIGTNRSGFSALLSGLKESNGKFEQLNLASFIWSSSQESSLHSYYLRINSFFEDAFIHLYYPGVAMSVRCLKDEK